MHDLDRSLQEYEAGLDALESDAYEMEYDQGEYDGEAVFDEIEEMELAAELLGVSDESELDQFFGKLIKSAAKAARTFVKSPVGKALGGVIKNVAKTALPMAGAALGNVLLPGVGGAVGGKLGSVAGQMFGLELEGLSPQDQEFEAARRIVRLAGEAAKQAGQSGQVGNPVAIAKDAVVAAAQKHAPGLVPGSTIGGAGVVRPGASAIQPPAIAGQRGQWVRVSRNRIVLIGA